MTESWRLWVNPLGGLPLFVWWLASSSLSSTPSTWSEELMSNHNEQTFSDDVNPDLCCGSHQTTSWIHSASSSSCSGERWVPYYNILLPEFPFGPGCSSGNFWTAGQSRVWQAWPAELGCDHHCRHWALDLHQVWVRGKSQTFWLLFLYQMGDDHEAPTKAHCSMVGAWCRPPAGLHCRQVLPAQAQPCAAAWEGAHQGWVTPG